MANACIVVADGGRARIFTVATDESGHGQPRLVERAALTNTEKTERGRSGRGRVRSERNTNRQAGPMHPFAAQRERHRLEHERRFGAEIVAHTARLVADWSEGRTLLIAEPRLLGLMRERLRRALKRVIRLEELAKDYSGLSNAELERLFTSQRLIQ